MPSTVIKQISLDRERQVFEITVVINENVPVVIYCPNSVNQQELIDRVLAVVEQVALPESDIPIELLSLLGIDLEGRGSG